MVDTELQDHLRQVFIAHFSKNVDHLKNVHSKFKKNLPYEIQERKVIGETPDLRVAEYYLAPGEFIPWHFHSKITDTFYCLQGELHIETPKPGQLIRLQPGESFLVPKPQPHYVFNGGKALCRFILVQGVGSYDFLPIKDPSKL